MTFVDNEKFKWTVGTTVYHKADGDFEYDGPYKIGKVYKNGNFVLDGERQQWAPYGRTAHMTGTVWSRVMLIHGDDPDLPTHIEDTKAFRKLQQLETLIVTILRRTDGMEKRRIIRKIYPIVVTAHNSINDIRTACE